MHDSDKFDRHWGRVVEWFKSPLNTGIFIVGMGLLGVGISYLRNSAAVNAADGPVPAACIMATPKAEVSRAIEFFMLTCPHCAKIEPYLSKIPSGVVRRHIVWNRSTEDMARFVFALVKTNHEQLIFDAEKDVSERSLGVFIYDTVDAAEFARKHGLNMAEMKSISNDAAADEFIEQTRLLQEVCGVRGVPALMRNGEIVTPSGAGGYEAAVDKVVSVGEKVFASIAGKAE